MADRPVLCVFPFSLVIYMAIIPVSPSPKQIIHLQPALSKHAKRFHSIPGPCYVEYCEDRFARLRAPSYTFHCSFKDVVFLTLSEALATLIVPTLGLGLVFTIVFVTVIVVMVVAMVVAMVIVMVAIAVILRTSILVVTGVPVVCFVKQLLPYVIDNCRKGHRGWVVLRVGA